MSDLSFWQAPTALGRVGGFEPPRHAFVLVSDDRLIAAAQRGHEAAFEAIYERYARAILGFSRQMLGSVEDAEDVVQHTFFAASRQLQMGGRDLNLKAWLFTVARNRCLTVLRDAREEPTEDVDRGTTTDLADVAERQVEVRYLLADIKELPEKHRAALLLVEAAGLTHAEIAEVLGCQTRAVKSYVFQARGSLIACRRARETPCAEIREQLSPASGRLSSLVRRHLRHCRGCRDFDHEVRRQRWFVGTSATAGVTRGARSAATRSCLRRAGACRGGRRRSDRFIHQSPNRGRLTFARPLRRHLPAS